MAMNLVELIDRFGNDEECRNYLESLRWPGGVACLRCGDMDVHDLGKYNRWGCRGCRYQFSVTTGTIMHDSHLPLATRRGASSTPAASATRNWWPRLAAQKTAAVPVRKHRVWGL